MLALVLAGASIMLSAYLFSRLATEGAERRDQSCEQFEGDHLADVKRLKRTYAYLDKLPREEWGKPITVAIVQQLPELEEQARKDSAPEFCDEPGAKAEARGEDPVGLPEPDPDVPDRRDFSALLKRP